MEDDGKIAALKLRLCRYADGACGTNPYDVRQIVMYANQLEFDNAKLRGHINVMRQQMDKLRRCSEALLHRDAEQSLMEVVKEMEAML